MTRPVELEMPEPGAGALAHSEALLTSIRTAIEAAGGQISFERYMELTLYQPGLGYYSAGATKFGQSGDFVTAPEISPLFGHCIARQVAQVMQGLNDACVLEVGAGSGRLAVDVLQGLNSAGAPLPERYQILERSADLRARQQRHVHNSLTDEGLSHRVCWIDELPAHFSGVILANELLDALPAAVFEISSGGLCERHVAWDDGLCWATAPASALLQDGVDAVTASLPDALPTGYRSEYGFAVRAWVADLAHRLDAGLMLLIDYGYPRREYYHPQRGEGTLRCHYRHRAHDDPLIWPGLQDISVHVDFTAVAEAGAAEGLKVAGFTSQAGFLLATGLLDAAQGAAAQPGSRDYVALAHQIKRLTLPGEMGEAIKVIGLVRGELAPLIGFAEMDYLHRL